MAMIERKKQVKVCYHCGSGDVLCDAYAAWDVDSQQWELSSTFDKGAFCNACDGETRIVSKPVECDEPIESED
jgi:hypothetical protein